MTPPPNPLPEAERGSKAEIRPPVRFIVCGQPVEEVKAIRARELRRQMTPAESALWQRLRRSQVLGLSFRRQQVIDGFIADFYCHAVGLVVEVDGTVHGTQPECDAQRDRIFATRGLSVLRLRNETVLHTTDRAVAQIETACRHRLAAPLLPLPGAERGRPKGRRRGAHS